MTHLQKFQQRLAPLAEAALISSPQNCFYLSRFSFEDGYLLITPQAAYLLTDFRYAEAAKKEADPDFEIICPPNGMIKEIDRLLGREGAQTLLLEEEHVTLSWHRALGEGLARISLVLGASRALAALRICKDGRELAAIKEAQRLTDAAFSHILSYIKPGLREIDIALELEHFMRQNGAEGLAFPTIAVSGSASALPHGVPRDLPLEKGFLTMDFGARFGGYCADMTRTVCIGRADAEMKRLYGTVLAAQRAALAAARLGIGCAALDGVARDRIENAGYHGAFGHSLGHGVGIDIHEAPRLSQRADAADTLQAGHVVTIEPGIYLAGKYGCRIEDLIALNEQGEVVNLTQSEKELIEVATV